MGVWGRRLRRRPQTPSEGVKVGLPTEEGRTARIAIRALRLETRNRKGPLLWRDVTKSC